MKNKIRIVAMSLLIMGGITACSGSGALTLQTDLAKQEELENITTVIEPNQTELATAEQGLAQGENKLTEEVYQELFKQQTGRYAFDTLSLLEKYWYVDIYRILESMWTDVELHEEEIKILTVEDIDKLFKCVLNDHPEIFYVTGYTYTQHTKNDELIKITFSGTYTMDAEEKEVRIQQIAMYEAECLSGISNNASEYDKVKYVYEYIIAQTEYNQDAAENQNICSVFIGRESVCQGYAKATQYLLERLGVKSTLVIGKVDNGEGHAWNLVQIDKNYYYVDTTWGDASYQLAEETEPKTTEDLPLINYDYLCVTTDQLCQTHIIDNVVPMPRCVSLEANYYVMEGAYFVEYNEEQLKELFQKGYDEKRSDVTLKCSNYDVYHAIFEQLITSQRIFKYLSAPNGTIAYAENDNQLSLTFWLTQE